MRARAAFAAGVLALGAPAVAHEGGHGQSAMWSACEAHRLDDSCSFQTTAHEVHRGTCQMMVETLACVRNQPLGEAATAEPTSASTPAVAATHAAAAVARPTPAQDWAQWGVRLALALVTSASLTVGLTRQRIRS